MFIHVLTSILAISGVSICPCLHTVYSFNNVTIPAITQDNLIYILKGPAESYMSCVMRKPAFYTCENKGEDQLRDTHGSRYIDSTISLLLRSKILRL